MLSRVNGGKNKNILPYSKKRINGADDVDPHGAFVAHHGDLSLYTHPTK